MFVTNSQLLLQYPELFNQVKNYYNESHRFYHNWDHIVYGFLIFDKIKDFKVRKNYTNFFKQKFFEKFSFKLNKIEKYKTQENLANKEIINANKIIERVLI